jgi:hypothetical protein
MKIYHTSPAPISTINDDGAFGESLCFSSSIYSMSVGDVVVYSLEIDEADVIDAGDFEFSDAPLTLQRLARFCECDDDQALEYLSGRDNHPDPETDWFIQGLMGSAAKEAGYRAARSRDEQGAVYIVPLLGQESELVPEG